MDDKTWERYGALGGVWFVVLAVVGSIIAGNPPSRTDSPAEIAAHYLDKSTEIQVSAFLTALGVIGFVWWFGTLWRAMTRAEDGAPRLAVIALIGLLLSGIGAMGGFAIDAGTAASAELVGDGASIFYQISSVSFGFSAMGDVVMAVAVGGLVLRTAFLPRWVGYLSGLVAVLSLLAMIGIASDADFFRVMGFVAVIAWGVWIIVIGVLNHQKLGAAG